MKTLSLEQMEVINGGKGSCAKEGFVFLGSVVLSLGTTGFTAGLSWTIAAIAYGDYFACQYERLSAPASTTSVPISWMN